MGAIVQIAFDRSMGFLALQQVWHCEQCGTLRVWGWQWPADSLQRPLLRCRCCHKPTRHQFVEVA
jgi:hypothetical protein